MGHPGSDTAALWFDYGRVCEPWVEVTPTPWIVVQPLEPGALGHPRQFSVALTVPPALRFGCGKGGAGTTRGETR